MLACSSVNYETANKTHRNSPLISKYSQWMTLKAKTTYFFKPNRLGTLQKPPCPSQGGSERGPHSTARPLGRTRCPWRGQPGPHRPLTEPAPLGSLRAARLTGGTLPAPGRHHHSGRRSRAPHGPPEAEHLTQPQSLQAPRSRQKEAATPARRPHTEPPLTPRPPRYLGRRRALPFLSALPQNGGGFLPLCLLPARGWTRVVGPGMAAAAGDGRWGRGAGTARCWSPGVGSEGACCGELWCYSAILRLKGVCVSRGVLLSLGTRCCNGDFLWGWCWAK